MGQKNKNAFTLVELIVVVTIIAILGTVGFISYSNYLTTARDSNRISQLTKIADALQVYTTTNSLPLPDNSVTITSGTNTIAYQGDLGEAVLQTIDYSTNARDPKDNTPFTYFLSADRLNFQLLAFMEDQSSLQSFLPNLTQSYANLYQNRFPKTYGRRLGVLTDTDNTPLQNLTITDSTLDISNTTLTLKSFLTDTDFVEGTTTTFADLSTLIPQRGRFWSVVDNAFVYTGTEELTGGTGGGTPVNPYASCTTAGTILTDTITYQGCNTPDIIVCGGSGTGYTIAACNVGATTASTDWTVSRGEYFQWGRNKGFAYGDISQQSTTIAGSIGLNASTDTFDFVWSSSISGVWANTVIIDNWGHVTNTNIARQGPCAPGYRVPSTTDWQNLVSAGGWGTTQGAAMQTALQLPYAGNRNWSNGTWNNGGSYGFYWSSSPSGPNGHYLYFNSSFINSSNTFSRAGGFSVRCFKN